MLFKKFLGVLCVTAQIVSPLLAKAEQASTTTAALQNVAGGLNTINQGFSALAYSQNQMQLMVNQFSALPGQMANAQNAQSQFQQVQQQIEAAKTEAALCVEKAKADTSKYKKAKYSSGDLDKITPTCSNYGAILDSTRKTIAEMQATNAKMACIVKLQNTVNQIAEKSKATFTQLTQAAQKVWDTHDSIINAHQGIVDRLEKDLNDKDTGYKAQLSKLKEMEAKIRNALGAGASKEGAGINQQLREIKRQRTATGNLWYVNLMQETETCFNSKPQSCDSNGFMATTQDCIRAKLGSKGNGGPSQKALAYKDLQQVGPAYQKLFQAIQRTDTRLENVDVKDPQGFLVKADEKFQNKMKALNYAIQGMQLSSTENKNDLAAVATKNYSECYQQAREKFNSDIAVAGGGAYKEGQNTIGDKEQALQNQIKNLIEDGQQAMTGFKTAFNKVYDRNLSQFSSDCTASEDVYASADCLRRMQLTLKGGIEGTRQTAILEDKSSVSYTPNSTVLNIQSLSKDASGNVSLSNTQTSCVGFDECINVMDRVEKSHIDQLEAQKKERDGFVKSSNDTISGQMALIAGQFSAASEIFAGASNAINEELTKAGVTASVKTKQVEGEELKKNEKTGLYDLPKNMKGALAGLGSYTEIDASDVASAYNSRMGELNKILADAGKSKAACEIKQSNLDEIVSRLGECDAKKLCDPKRQSNFIKPVEELLTRSRKEGKTESLRSGDGVTSDFDRCMKNARDDSRSSSKDSTDSYVQLQLLKEMKEQGKDISGIGGSEEKKQKQKLEDQKDCADDAFRSLDALSSDSRESMKGINGQIMKQLQDITNACSDGEEGAADAEAACDAVKRTVRKFSLPDEGETKVEEGSGSTGYTNPLSNSAK